MVRRPADAIRQGEDEARQYCRAIRFVNAYGQRVRLKYLRVAEAFSMLDREPASRCEVFSLTALVPSSVSDARVIKQRFGEPRKGEGRSRLKFLDAKLLPNYLSRNPLAKGRRLLCRQTPQ